MDIFLIIALVVGVIIFFIGVIILDDIKLGFLLNSNQNIHKKRVYTGNIFVCSRRINSNSECNYNVE